MRWCVERSAHRTWVSGTGHWCEGGIGDEESRQNVRADWPARARAGTVRARLWHRKGGVRPRYGRCRRFPARSRRADVRTIPDVTSRGRLSRCLVISVHSRKLLGVCARTVLPRSRHTAANDDAVRVLAPVDTIREVRESSRRAVVHARLLGASHRRGCSSQNRRGFGRETTLAPDGSRP